MGQVHLAGTHGVQGKLDGLLQFVQKYGILRETAADESVAPPAQHLIPAPPAQALIPAPPAVDQSITPAVSQEATTVSVVPPPPIDYRCAFCDYSSETPAPVRNHLRTQHVT